MKKYLYLKHTADAKFQAFGSTLEEAFANAALATAALMWDPEKIQRNHERKVRVEGKDLMQLLYSFLEEILYLLDTEKFFLGAAEEVVIGEEGGTYRLEAQFKGDTASDLYEICGDVKAITYNEMEIKQNHMVTLQVVVDV